MNSTCPLRTFTLIAFAVTTALGCQNKVPPPEAEPKPVIVTPGPATSSSVSAVSSVAATTESASPVAAAAAPSGASSTKVATGASTAAAPSATPPPQSSAGSAAPVVGDPLQGKFTLEDATKGLPKAGKLSADIVTDSGTLKCELYEDKAPITVANFVGLARGIRPFKDPKTGEWGKRPGYDNGVFHRIIKGFMIQGGDPTGTGATDGGYVIPDEVWPGATHNRRGLICMANRGKHTNSMQFFITDGAAPHLDSGYTIFGSCGPDAVIEKLAAVEVRGDRAVNPPKIKKVTVKRGK